MCYFYVLLLLLFQDTNKQIQNDERLGLEYPNQIDSEDSETDETSEIPKVRRQILPDD